MNPAASPPLPGRAPAARLRSYDTLFAQHAQRLGDKPALIAYRADRPDEPPRRLSYAQLDELVARAAAGLRRLGVVRGDVVAVQLPNWWQFTVVALACMRCGAVLCPLTPVLRERELGFILPFAQARVAVVAATFRGFDHRAMMERLRTQAPQLAHVICVDGEGPSGFEQALLAHDAAPLAAADPALRDDDLALVIFTSGTTGEPKGVMHSHRTLTNSTDSFAVGLGLDADDVVLVASTVGHLTGFLACLMEALTLGATAVMLDVWDPRRALEIMQAQGVSFSAGATPFLADLCNAVAAGSPRPARLRRFLCAGAPIPPVLVERAAAELELQVCAQWGMSEAISATLTEPALTREKAASTDGRGFQGMEVRVVDAAGRVLPPGQTGRLLVRGPRLFVGYLGRPREGLFDADGWFDSGDLAYADADGYIRISGRSKDMLVRGGENVPVLEIENLLARHPAIAAVALVGYPDARLGERGCAFVTLREGASFDLAELRRYMAQCQVAVPYWPERVEPMAEMPRTASGKIQKFVLREIASRFGDAAAGTVQERPT